MHSTFEGLTHRSSRFNCCFPELFKNMADTPDEAPPEPVTDKDQMIADLQHELAGSNAVREGLAVGAAMLRKKLADSEAMVLMLKTPKKLKDGLKKDGSPDMRQTKGKALAAAAAAAEEPPPADPSTDRDRYFYATIFDVEAI